MRSDDLRRIVLPVVALAAVLVVLQIPRAGGVFADLAEPVFSRTRGFADFDLAYYPAAVAIRHDPQSLYRGRPYELGGAEATHFGRAYYVNLPLVAWLFVPFTMLGPKAAGLALLVLNIAVTLVCLTLILVRLRRAPPRVAWAVTLAFVSSGPLQRALNMGQTTPWILLILLLCERALWRRADLRAGLWLGLACVIKVPPLVWIPLLALRGRWRAVAAASGVVGVLVILSLACYGSSLHLDYIQRAFASHAGASVGAFGNQSLAALLIRGLSSADLLEYTPQQASLAMKVCWWAVTLVLTAGFVRVLVVRNVAVDHQRLQLELGSGLAFALIVLPISWVYYGVWLLPVVVVVAAAWWGSGPTKPRSWSRLVALSATVVLINVPVLPPWMMGRMQDALWFRLAMSHQAIGQIGLFLLCLATLWPTRPPWRVERARC